MFASKAERMTTPKGGLRPATKSKSYLHSKLFKVYLFLIISFVSILTIDVWSLTTALHFGSGCCHTEQIEIWKVTFGSSQSQVSFWFGNSGVVDVTVTEAFVGSYRNPDAFITTHVVTHPGTNLTLTVTFQNITFQPGTTYSLGLVSAGGYVYPTTTTR